LQRRRRPIKSGLWQLAAVLLPGWSIGRCEEFPLLTESEVQRSFRNLFKSKDVAVDAFDKAEALLEELRAESPLRHRLSIELDEIRKLHTAKV
jgi:hypothetical protein